MVSSQLASLFSQSRSLLDIAFEPPGTFLSYLEPNTKSKQYLELLSRSGPIFYPKRLASTAPGGAMTSLTILQEFDPSESKHHVFKVYMGVPQGYRVQLFHPYDTKRNLLDNRSFFTINEDLITTFTYDSSPWESPRVSFWVLHERFPGVQVRNVGITSGIARVNFVMASYKVNYDEELPPNIKDKLRAGEIPALPIDIGGES